MIRMNYLVNTKHQKASDVARKYLLRKKTYKKLGVLYESSCC